MLIIFFLLGILLLAVAVIAWLMIEFRQEGSSQSEVAVVLSDLSEVKSDEFTDKNTALSDSQPSLADKNENHDNLIIDKLKAQVEELNQKVASLEALPFSQDDETLLHLRAENVAFKAQLDEATRQLKDFQEGMSRIEGENLRIRSEFEGVIEQLRIENQQLRENSSETAEQKGLEEKVSELTSKVRELEVTNAIQAEKNTYIQYELTKSRAQVVGLERLCGQVTGVIGS